MKNLLGRAALALAVLTAAPAVAANADLYNCVFKDTKGKLLPDELLIALPDASDEYVVMDVIIKTRIGNPIPAETLRDDAKRLDLKWTYLVPDRQGTQARILFRLVYFKKTKKAQMSSQPMGFTNHWSSRGTCRVRRGDM